MRREFFLFADNVPISVARVLGVDYNDEKYSLVQ